MQVLCILLCVAFASGFHIDNNGTREEKIIGGWHARIEDVPYQASLLHWMSVNNICGATIIHKSWVITTAHCVENKTRVSVRTGTNHRNKRLGKVYNSVDIISHPDYDKDGDDNDIALIKLAKPIKFDNKQRPIPLAKPHDIPREGEMMQVSGFGRIGAAHVRVLSQEDCEKAYESEEPITHNMFCASSEEADTCDGDSGGPGVINGKLYGITCSGQYCESKTFPGVYTRVHKYYDWIEEKTGLRF